MLVIGLTTLAVPHFFLEKIRFCGMQGNVLGHVNVRELRKCQGEVTENQWMVLQFHFLMMFWSSILVKIPTVYP